MLSLSVPSATVVEASNLLVVADAFLGDCQERVSEKTYVGYRNQIMPFLKWWQERAPQHSNTLSATVFREFVSYLETDYRNSLNQPASPYVRRMITIRVRHLLSWAFDRGLVGQRISDLCPLYHDPGRVKHYPTIEELQRLFVAPVGPYRLRDLALLAFLVTTGARRFEVAAATVDGLHFGSPLGDLSVAGDHGGYVVLRVVKGDASGQGLGRVSVFCRKAGLLLKIWLQAAGTDAGSLFGLGDTGVREVVQNAAQRAGLPDLHPHAFRSALIDYWTDRHARDGHLSDIALKLQVGHAIDRRNATNFYIDHRNRAKALKWLREFHVSPLDEIEIDWTRLPVHRL